MSDDPARTAVCVVRAERQHDGVLITLRMNANIEDGAAERLLRLADVDAAADAVRSFLVGFARDAPG